MRTALLISGYLRSYRLNLKFIKENIIKDNNTDVYIHITNDEIHEDKYLNNIKDRDVEYVIDNLNPISVIIENNINFNNSILENNTINNWSKFFKLNEIKKINEICNNFKYDLVIKYRFDLCIKDKLDFSNLEDNCVYIPKNSKIDKTKLKNYNDNYICDAFAFGKSSIMDEYFNIFKNINKFIEKYSYVSETILYEYLKEFKIKYKLIDIDYKLILSKCNVFAICGDSGSGKTTLSNLLKQNFNNSFLLECDRYHKWERNDEKWNSYTHLDPDANYIEKMNEDIFNLTIGNNIYQVDYDHTIGKFTEKKEINSSDNLIVCGLHCLYNTDNIYNIKIFIDTDEKLKRKWKLIRDIKERKQSKAEIINKIEKRKDDYYKYILPQREDSDLIIRFFPKDKINFKDLSINDEICLDIKIKKTFRIDNILKQLKYSDIKYKNINDENESFVTIRFESHENNIKDFYMRNNTFYDYIIFFILNLKYKN